VDCSLVLRTRTVDCDKMVAQGRTDDDAIRIGAAQARLYFNKKGEDLEIVRNLSNSDFDALEKREKARLDQFQGHVRGAVEALDSPDDAKAVTESLIEKSNTKLWVYERLPLIVERLRVEFIAQTRNARNVFQRIFVPNPPPPPMPEFSLGKAMKSVWGICLAAKQMMCALAEIFKQHITKLLHGLKKAAAAVKAALKKGWDTFVTWLMDMVDSVFGSGTSP